MDLNILFHGQEKVTYPIQVGLWSSLSLGVLFMSEGITEHKTDRWIGVAVFLSVCHRKGAELKNKALDLIVSRHFYHHQRS